MKKIAVLMGGRSSEREVSLASGRNVAEALASLSKYEVIPVDLTEENLDALPSGVDAVYIALHGGWGENGGVQAALNARKIPYTGPGVLASQIAMDKVKTKMILEMKRVPTAAWGLANADTPASPLPLPVVVKPPCDGSSVGISKVSRPEDWPAALQTALRWSPEVEVEKGTLKFHSPPQASTSSVVLVEEFIPGREFTVGIIDGEPLPAIEIVAKGGWYGYEEKYRSNETRYEFLGGTGNGEQGTGNGEQGTGNGELEKKLQRIALDAYRAVGCRGVTRVDFRVSPLGRCYVLELNTSPGFTAHSLVPKAGMRTGLSFAGVCDRILSCAEFDR